MVALLLEKGGAMDAKKDDGSTPIDGAAERGHLALADLLLKKGAAADKKGGWPGSARLRYAAREGDSSGDLERPAKSPRHGSAADAGEGGRRSPLPRLPWLPLPEELLPAASLLRLREAAVLRMERLRKRGGAPHAQRRTRA